ncbi:MAG TPA: hypothetical protein VNN10_05925 [Dehalococcoidia bacterium]|nr:hypothetical protein [Dehalococcoidia bacterium]
MISEQELRRKLDALKDELDRARQATSDIKVRESLGAAEAIVEELRSSAGSSGKKHNIMEWWGVGAEFWRKMDVDDYVRKERDSWR